MDAHTTLCMVSCTFPDQEIAQQVAQVLVEEQLCACVHIGAPLVSVYRWQGILERTNEVQLCGKTRAVLVERVFARIRSLHPYQTPALTAWPLTQADAEYHAWVLQNTTV